MPSTPSLLLILFFLQCVPNHLAGDLNTIFRRRFILSRSISCFWSMYWLFFHFTTCFNGMSVLKRGYLYSLFIKFYFVIYLYCFQLDVCSHSHTHIHIKQIVKHIQIHLHTSMIHFGDYVLRK